MAGVGSRKSATSDDVHGFRLDGEEVISGYAL